VRSVWRHAKAEALRLFRDPGALLVLVGAVILYSFFYPIPYLPQVLREVPVAVVDLDHTALSRQLARMADAHTLLDVRFRPDSLAEAQEQVVAGRAGGVLVIPRGFEESVLLRQRAQVGVFADASYFLVYRQVATGLRETVGTLSAGIDIRRLESRGKTEAAARAARDPIPFITRPLFNTAEGYASYIVPAVLVLILQQTLLVGIGLLGGTAAERREQNPGTSAKPSTWTGDNLRPSRWRSALARVIGRAAFYVCLYSVYTVLLFTAVFRVYGFPQRGQALDLAAFALPFLLACVFFALGLGGLFSRRETAMQVLLFTSLPSVFLAGFAWPLEAVPTWLRWASLFLPSTAGIAGFLRLAEMGASLSQVRFEWTVLWGLTALYFALALVSERRSA
jgi:ABC-2 type transport system permease protein